MLGYRAPRICWCERDWIWDREKAPLTPRSQGGKIGYAAIYQDGIETGKITENWGRKYLFYQYQVCGPHWHVSGNVAYMILEQSLSQQQGVSTSTLFTLSPDASALCCELPYKEHMRLSPLSTGWQYIPHTVVTKMFPDTAKWREGQISRGWRSLG